MRRPACGRIPPVALDRTSATLLHRQISRSVAAAIRNGTAGSRLPSTRALAALLGISRNTVVAAYDELVADGLVRAARGSGMRVVRYPASGPLHGGDLGRVVRSAHYPTRAVRLADPDGNPLYIAF